MKIYVSSCKNFLRTKKKSIKFFCKLITFDNPIEACILNKKYPIRIQTHHPMKNVNSTFLIEKLVLTRFFKDYWCLKSVNINFGTAMLPIELLKVINPTPHTRISDLSYLIKLLHIKPNQKLYENSFL